ncbi:Hypothetical protein D9617_14g076060 [Elsinoe fawcettii]|nr:Hypothetical protein D9617_14g076060 [Elsinoe fawcettii]
MDRRMLDHLVIAADLAKARPANDIEAISQRRKSTTKILEYLDRSKEFEDVDLDQQVNCPLTITSHPATYRFKEIMTREDPDPTPVMEKKPEQYEYSITTAEDGFEAVHADPHPIEDLSGSYADIEAASEGGQTADTVSTCDQSDAETVESIADDEDVEDENQHGSKLLFPDPAQLPSATARELTTGTVPSAARLSQSQNQEGDAEGRSIDQSEITVRGAEDINETSKKNGDGVDQDPKVETMSDILDRSIILTKDFCKAHLRTAILPMMVTLVLASFVGLMVGPHSPSSSLALRPSSWFAPSISAQDEMFQRHNALRPILALEGLKNWNGQPVEPADVLKYPKSVIVGDTEYRGFEYTFQNGVNINCAGRDQMFLALPKDKRGRRYLTGPNVEVRRTKERTNVKVVSQKDLIAGLTLVRLDTDMTDAMYQVKVRTGHVDTTVHVICRQPFSARQSHKPSIQPPKASSPSEKGPGIVTVINNLFHDVGQLSEGLVASSARAAHKVQKSVQDHVDNRWAIYKVELDGHRLRAQDKLEKVYQTIKGAALWESDATEKDHSVKPDKASSANTSPNAILLDIVTSARQLVDGAVDIAFPAVQHTVEEARFVLARAQRNARGIFRRVEAAVTAQTTKLSEKQVHGDIKKKSKRHSCKKNTRRSGKHGH